MKKLVNPGLGAAAFPVFLTLAAIFLNSCGNDSSNAPSKTSTVSGRPILYKFDSSTTIGHAPGTGGPKTNVLLTVSCPTADCAMLQPSSSAVTANSDTVTYVVEARTTGSIPDSTNLRFQVVVTRSSVSAAAGAMKK